jgi:hypothetical protein
VALAVKRYDLEADVDSYVDEEVGLRLAKQPVNDRIRLLLHPYGNNEPKYRRFVVGILNLTRTTATGLEKIEGQGQIVLTSHRILGLVTDGAHNAEALSEAAGKVTGFSINRSDILDAQIPTNWRGSPKRVTFAMSSTGSAPFDIALDIQVLAAAIADGKATPSTIKAFVEALDDKSAAALR